MVQPKTENQALSETSTHEEAPSGIAAIGVDGTFLLAQVINFLILFAVLGALLFKPLAKVLEERKAKITEGLKFAEQSKQDALMAQEETEKILGRAKVESQKIISEAKDSAEKIAQSIKEQANRESQSMILRTQEALSREKDNLLAEVESELGTLITQATAKVLTGKKVDLTEPEITEAIKTVREEVV